MNLHDTAIPSTTLPKTSPGSTYPTEADKKKLEPTAPTPDPVTKVKPQPETTEL